MAQRGPKIKGDSKRSHNVQIRITDKEHEMLEKCVEYYELSKTDVIITGIDILYHDAFGDKKSNS